MSKYKGVTDSFVERTEAAMEANGHNVSIYWDTVRVENKSRTVDLKCNKCNATYSRVTKSLSKGILVCQNCIKVKYEKSFAAVGFTIIEYLEKQKTLCGCNTCGTTTTICLGTVMNGNKPRCKTCLDLKYSKMVEKIGFDYVCYNGDNTLDIRCKKDGSVLTVRISALTCGFVGKSSCKQCQIDNLKDALSKKDCKFVEMYSTGKYGKLRVKYTNQEGELFEATSGNILEGKFTTSTQGHWRQPHEVYCTVVEYNGEKFIKIGTANKSSKRIKDLKLAVDNVEIHVLKKFSNRFEADDFEQLLHDKYKPFNLDRSIPEKFTNLYKNVKYANGSINRVCEGTTEWFSSEILNEVLSYKDNP